MHRIALFAAILALCLVPAGAAQAQFGAPNAPDGLTQPPPPPPPEAETFDDGGLSTLQPVLIFGGAALVLALIAFVIVRDARRAAPVDERRGATAPPAKAKAGVGDRPTTRAWPRSAPASARRPSAPSRRRERPPAAQEEPPAVRIVALSAAGYCHPPCRSISTTRPHAGPPARERRGDRLRQPLRARRDRPPPGGRRGRPARPARGLRAARDRRHRRLRAQQRAGDGLPQRRDGRRHHRRPGAVSQRDPPPPAAHRGGGGRALQAHRAGRPGGQGADDQLQPRARRLDRQEVPAERAAAAGPHPGGHLRPDPRDREVRLAARLQVLDLRDVLDPPGDPARHREQGAHDPRANEHRPARAQDPAHAPHALGQARPRPDRRGDRRRPPSCRSSRSSRWPTSRAR